MRVRRHRADQSPHTKIIVIYACLILVQIWVLVVLPRRGGGFECHCLGNSGTASEAIVPSSDGASFVNQAINKDAGLPQATTVQQDEGSEMTPKSLMTTSKPTRETKIFSSPTCKLPEGGCIEVGYPNPKSVPCPFKRKVRASHGETGSWVLKDDFAYFFDQKLADGLMGLFNQGDRVIELGAGLGCYSYYYHSSKKLASISPSDGVADIANRTEGFVQTRDLTKEQSFQEDRSDWVVCLEVAEHVPKEGQDVFVGNILKTSPTNLVLSWGVPAQRGGLGHVNLRTNDYVVDLMKEHGYTHDEPVSQRLRDEAQLGWFKISLMVFHKA